MSGRRTTYTLACTCCLQLLLQTCLSCSVVCCVTTYNCAIAAAGAAKSGKAVQAICCSTKSLDVTTHGTTHACTTSTSNVPVTLPEAMKLTFCSVVLYFCNHTCSSLCMRDRQTPTRNNVWHMHVLHSAAVLPDGGPRLAVPVALMGARPIPLHLLALLGHSKVKTNARQGPAPCPLCRSSQAGWCGTIRQG